MAGLAQISDLSDVFADVIIQMNPHICLQHKIYGILQHTPIASFYCFAIGTINKMETSELQQETTHAPDSITFKNISFRWVSARKT